MLTPDIEDGPRGPSSKHSLGMGFAICNSLSPQALLPDSFHNARIRHQADSESPPEQGNAWRMKFQRPTQSRSTT